MLIRSEMETPSGYGIADTSYSFHPEVRPLKGYEHSNTNQARSKELSHFHKTHLHFIKFYYVVTSDK